MRVRGIVGVTIGTARFGEMAGLLGDVLGLDALVAASGHAIYQSADGDLLELRASELDGGGAGGVTIELEVADLDEARCELEEAGLPIVDTDGDGTWLAFRAPDGTLVALRQELDLGDVLDGELEPLDDE
ncbi:MAG: hypothetical protein R3C15_21990 [Thermoleophilia bacterium]